MTDDKAVEAALPESVEQAVREAIANLELKRGFPTFAENIRRGELDNVDDYPWMENAFMAAAAALSAPPADAEAMREALQKIANGGLFYGDAINLATAALRSLPPAQAAPGNALPERDPEKTNEQQGLYRKFAVHRTDGSDAPGGKHYGCDYFVLDVTHDQHAKAALSAYAAAVEAAHPVLAADMRKRYALAASPPAPAAPSNMAAFGASDAACYLYPGEDQAKERAAYIAGAAAHAPAAPETVKGALSDERIYEIADSEECNPNKSGWGHKFDVLVFARAIERAALSGGADKEGG